MQIKMFLFIKSTKKQIINHQFINWLLEISNDKKLYCVIAIDSATITRTTDGSPQRKSNLPSNCLLAAVMREKPKRTMVYPVYVYINYLSIYLSQVLLAGATVVPSPGSPVSTPRPATSSSGSTTACKTTDKMLNDINALKKKLSVKRQIKA